MNNSCLETHENVKERLNNLLLHRKILDQQEIATKSMINEDSITEEKVTMMLDPTFHQQQQGESSNEPFIEMTEPSPNHPSADHNKYLLHHILNEKKKALLRNKDVIQFLQNNTQQQHHKIMAMFQIMNLLDKMSSSDKDFRFMAINDLIIELEKDNLRLDDMSERKVVSMMLKLLEDKNGEVQNLTVKCLGLLISKIRDDQVCLLIDSLAKSMLSEKEELREISSSGLKTVISELKIMKPWLSETISERITNVLENMGNLRTSSLHLEAIDILADLLIKSETLRTGTQENILKVLLPKLSSSPKAVCKRTITALSYLVLICDYDIYEKLIQNLLEELSPDVKSTTGTIIQCLAAICKQAGHLFAEYIDQLLPIIVRYMNNNDDELREQCFQAYAIFIRGCPIEILPHIEIITQQCQYFIKYDPNYLEQDDVIMEEEEEEEYDDDDDYSDDEDISWKVRKGAVKCLDAVLSIQHEDIMKLYTEIGRVLVAQFKERKESVKLELFATVLELFRNCKSNSLLQSEFDQKIFIRHLLPYLDDKNIRIRLGCFSLLKEYIEFEFGISCVYLAEIISRLLPSFYENHFIRIESLGLLNSLILNNPNEAIGAHVHLLIHPVLICVNDSHYKVISESLIVLQNIVNISKDRLSDSNISEVYSCTLSRFTSVDIDQEVKERSIICMAFIIANFGDHLQVQFDYCLPIFLNRLKNEMTQVTTVKAMVILASSAKLNLHAMFVEIVPILATFLRKKQRSLKINVLTLLEICTTKHLSDDTQLFRLILSELPALLNDDSDINITQLSIELVTSITKSNPASLPDVIVYIMGQIPIVLQSPLLQKSVFDSTLNFLIVLVSYPTPNVIMYRDVLNMLMTPITQCVSTITLHRQIIYSLSKCMAAITLIFENEILPITQQFMHDIINKTTNTHHIFALLIVAEIGQHIDLTNMDNLEVIIFASFQDDSEEIKSAASYTLGNIAVANLPYYLPFILKCMENEPKQKYLLLNSLKQIICHEKLRVDFWSQNTEYFDQIWAVLVQHFESNEDGTRNKVAECIGKLSRINPTNVAQKIHTALQSPGAGPLIRSTIIGALNTIICETPEEFHNLSYMTIFTEFLKDSDLSVRRSCLQLFNVIAHNHPKLIRNNWAEIGPRLYYETKVNPELIQQVQIGPFKQSIDLGLDLRKTAFECMYTLLETCHHWIDPYEFFNCLEQGLSDHYDIKIVCYLMVDRLAKFCPSIVLKCMQRLVTLLRRTLYAPLAPNSVKQEIIKHDELKQAAMRVVVTLLSIPYADKYLVLKKVVNEIQASAPLHVIFKSVSMDCNNSTCTEEKMTQNLIVMDD